MTTTKGEVVYTATNDWWQIRSDDFTLSDAWESADCERAAEVAGINTDDDESWACRIEAVGDERIAIKVGDYVCSQGIGDEVIFVRLAK